MPASTAQRFRLDGKVAIVTGASKGIGEAMAVALAAFGAKVLVSSRKESACAEVVARIEESGGAAAAAAAHMGDMAQARALVDEAIDRWGRVDIVVNNAATNPVFGPVLQTDETAFDRIMAVNVKGPFELCKAAQPHMLAQGGGAILNIASVGGLSPEPFLGIYSVSKAAIISLTKVLAKEWGSAGIRANAICPGLIRTKFSSALWQNEAILEHVLKDVSLGRIGTPDEMAGLAVFLCSDAASYVTGGVFTADGGLTT